MGIYDNKKKIGLKPGFKLNFEWKKFKYPAILIAGIILVLLVFFALQWLLQPQPISASLSPNPLNLAQAQTALLTVDVSNISSETALNAVLNIEAIADEMFVITPSSKEIPTLESGGRRQFVFQIRPFNKNDSSAGVPSGDYKIRIVFSINGQEFLKEVVLQVKSVS